MLIFLAPRTLALRKDVGVWVNDPQVVYDMLAHELGGKQVPVEELFWLRDQTLLLICL